MTEQRKDDLELKDLEQYYGTEGYAYVMGKKVTDGVGYIMQNGYSWFVTDMLAVIISKEFPGIVNNEEFLAIKLKVMSNKAVATIEDGNGKVLYTQNYEYTDAKKELTLYFTNDVLMLSGEY